MPLREPLLLPVCGLAAGIAAGRIAPFGWWDGVLGPLLLAVLAALLFRRGRPRAAAGVVALACVPFGGWLAHRARPEPPPSGPVAGVEQNLTGCVVRPLAGPADRSWFVLETAPRVRIRVALSGPQHPARPLIGYGRRLSFTAKVREPRNFRNPGSFDYAAYLAVRGIHWQAVLAQKSEVEVLAGDCGSRPAAMIFDLRRRTLARLDALYAHAPYQRGMMKGLLAGDSSEIQRVWVENFRRTGTYHALVISGSHISFVAGLFLLWWRLSRWGEHSLLTAAALAAWLYALVAGADPPVLRSAAGFSLAVAARFWYRRPRLLNIVAAVALLFLLADPWQLFEASFQLSFLAVTAIAVLAVPLIEKTSGPLHGALTRLSLPRRPIHGMDDPSANLLVELRLLIRTVALALRVSTQTAQRLVAWPLRMAALGWDLFLVSAAVQLALVLPMVFYFHRVSISGLVANVIVTPLITFAIPFGFAAILFNARWAADAAGGLLRLSERLVDWHAQWEPAWRVPDPPLWLALVFGAGVIGLAIALRLRRRWGWGAAAAAGAACAAIVLHPFPARLDRGVLELTAIDVGQGESLLLATPAGRTLLLDAGGLPVWRTGDPPRLDIGEDVVAPYLWARGIRRLDALVLSHLHQDHSGGAPAILECFRPAELWVGEQPPSKQWALLKERALRVGARIREFRQGDTLDWHGARFEVLAPHPPLEFARARGNDDGLILRVRHGRHAFLLTGDAEPRTERILLDGGHLDRVDVLKVAHHGSRRSSRADFLEATRPVFALISAGRDNPFRFPSERVLADLRAQAAMILRTDQQGLISIRSDGRRITVDTHASSGSPLPRLDPF